MSYSSRFYIYGPVGLLLLVVALYVVFWRVQADMLAARLDRANGGEVIPGIQFAFAEKSIGGFPFRLDAVLSGVTFSRRTLDGEIAWRTEELAIHRLSYAKSRYVFEAAGLQSIAFPPSMPGTVPQVMFVTPALARASAILNEGRLARFDLDLNTPQLREATQGADPTRTLAADRAQIHFLAGSGNTIAMVLRIDNFRIGSGFAAGGSAIALPLVEMRGAIKESDALDRLRAGDMGPDEAAAAWRDRMGMFAVESLVLNWTDARVTLSGDLALSSAGRLTGTLTGKGVQNQSSPAEFALAFDDGGMRLTASSTPAGSAP